MDGLKASETAMIMAVLKAAYPRYYATQTEEDSRQAAKLWSSMFEDYTYAEVAPAVKAVIATSKFPPTVADIIEKIRGFRGEEMSELEAWSYISRAIRNSRYHAREEWEALPESLQRVVTPDLLKGWAMIEAEDVETVIQSHFNRTYRTAQARQREMDMLPSSVKNYIAQIGGGADGLLGLSGQRDRALENKE